MLTAADPGVGPCTRKQSLAARRSRSTAVDTAAAAAGSSHFSHRWRHCKQLSTSALSERLPVAHCRARSRLQHHGPAHLFPLTADRWCAQRRQWRSDDKEPFEPAARRGFADGGFPSKVFNELNALGDLSGPATPSRMLYARCSTTPRRIPHWRCEEKATSKCRKRHQSHGCPFTAR